MGSPAFKAVMARFVDLGISTNPLVKSYVYCRRMLPHVGRSAVFRGVFAGSFRDCRLTWRSVAGRCARLPPVGLIVAFA